MSFALCQKKILKMMLVKSRAGTLSQPPNITSAQQSCDTGCTFSLCTSAALEMILVCVNLPILDYRTKCHANPGRVPRLTCFQEQVGW